MFLLDTNVVSALRKPRAENAHVWTWAGLQDLETLFLPVVTVLELDRGTLQMERRDIAQGAILRRWLNEKVLSGFADRIVPIDAAIAIRSAGLHVPNPRPERDALIAATALVHNLVVVTRNERDFQGTGVDLVNPWLL